MTSSLLLVLLLLAATIGFAATLVRHAHKQANEQTKPSSQEAQEGHGVSVFAADDTTRDLNPISPTAASFSAAAQTPQSQCPAEFARDVYADPIDGVPFTTGERVVPCGCGIAYREDSLDWLSGNLGGHCVQCGSLVEQRESYMFP